MSSRICIKDGKDTCYEKCTNLPARTRARARNQEEPMLGTFESNIPIRAKDGNILEAADSTGQCNRTMK